MDETALGAVGSKVLYGPSALLLISEEMSVKAFALLTCENSVTRKCKRWVDRGGLLGVAMVLGYS